MHPTLLQIADLTLPTYGVAMVAILVLVGGTLLWRASRDHRLSAFDLRNCFLIVLAAIFLSRWWVGFLDGNASRPGADPLAAYPVLVTTLLLLYAYTRLRRLSWPWLLDLLVPYALAAFALQRSFGCFLAGCCYGLPTDAAFGVRFPAGSSAGNAYPGLHLHPTQLYYAAATIGVLLMLWVYRTTATGRRSGDLGLLGLAGLSAGYLAVGSLRGDGWRLVSLSGLLALLVLGWALAMLAAARRGEPHAERHPKDTETGR